MKRHLFTTVAATAITASGVALAADLPTKAPPIGVAPVPVFSWSGCYIGGHVGLGVNNTRFQDTTPDGNIDAFTTSNRTAKSNGAGAVGGGQLGCDWQLSNWVLGLQGTFSGANIGSTNQDQFNAPWTLTSNVSWIATVTGRVGWAINNVLLYGKGGGAWTNNKMEIENSGVTIFNGSTTRTGWTLGTGVEWAFAPNWSAFAEANYYSFGNTTGTLVNNVVNDMGGANAPFTFNTKMQLETFLLGVNYRFRGF